MHQLAPDIKIDLNIVLKFHCYLCMFGAFYVLFMGFLCAITLQFVIKYLYHII